MYTWCVYKEREIKREGESVCARARDRGKARERERERRERERIFVVEIVELFDALITTIMY